MAIYLKVTEGTGSFDGDVTAKGFEKQIAVHSIQFGVGRGISSGVGVGGNREASQASVSEVVFTKDHDETSNSFLMESLSGKKGMKCLFSFVRTGEQPETYLTYTLEETLVSGYSLSSGGDRPSESISLNFTKVSTTFTPYLADHTAGTPNTTGWSVKENVKI